MGVMHAVAGEVNMELFPGGGSKKKKNSEDSGVLEGVLKNCFFNCGKNEPDV